MIETNVHGGRRSCQLKGWISDQKGAEQILERMGIASDRHAGGFPFMRLSADGPQCFTNLPR